MIYISVISIQAGRISVKQIPDKDFGGFLKARDAAFLPLTSWLIKTV